MAEPKYRVSYEYTRPGPAGPFKGAQIENRRYARGDDYHGPFGPAIVKSCREVKQQGGTKEV